MAFRNANASAKSRSALRRRRESFTNSTSTETSAMDMAVTKAGRMFGKRSGAARLPSILSIKVLPGRSNSCVAVNSRFARGNEP